MINSRITPGKPKSPTINADRKLTGICMLKAAPIKLKAISPTPPTMLLNISLQIILMGTNKIYPMTYKIIIPKAYASIMLTSVPRLISIPPSDLTGGHIYP